MFTGLVEEKGTVESLNFINDSARITINAKKIFSDLKIGDSVAVNGICLTVTDMKPPLFSADVMHETLNRTGFSQLKRGIHVNLERAMPANGRFGGHIVSGHIDGTGKVIDFRNDGIAVWIKISAGKDILKYIVEKGSICLDGVSLTVADVSEKDFSVSIIPHTASETILFEKKRGDLINIECDIIAKYVEKLANFKNYSKGSGGLTKEKLFENGFV